VEVVGRVAADLAVSEAPVVVAADLAVSEAPAVEVDGREVAAGRVEDAADASRCEESSKLTQGEMLQS
jgi:hypothetical protein